MLRCRLCALKLPSDSILLFKNMPSAAQNMPTAETLHSDKGVDLEVYQCSGCGLIQLASEPVSYYRDVIRAAAYSPEMKEFRLKQFREFVEKYSLSGKKIVEIGCGKGEYLSLMGECGVRAYGIEHLAESVGFCQKNGLNIQKGYIENEEYGLSDAPFDAFFILNFLEHIPNINSFLQGIVNNIADEGIGLVEVPNFDMMIKDKLFSEFMSDHLFYFTSDTLKRTLEINGFEVLSCEPIWHDYILSAVVKKRKKIDLSSFVAHKDKIVEELNGFVNTYGEKRVAIWGAGHQALAILTLSGVAPRIKYVVDSAVFKQGKYTPSTHLQIVSPEMFFVDKVDAVIIVAGSYSDEVAKIVKQKAKSDICISILRGFGLEIIK